MGKPFEAELEKLEKTYEWALKADVSGISETIRNTWGYPLLSVGSGGSFSAAEFQAFIHRTFSSSIGHAITPVETISALPRNGEVSVWLISASGNNVDIYRAFQHAALREMKFVNAIVGRNETRLHEASAKHQYTNCFAFPMPYGKDGFLATNSLLAFTVILYRAYNDVGNGTTQLPQTLNALFKKCMDNFHGFEQIKEATKSLWKKKYLHIIYSLNLKPAALDIESKFTEAGLISSHLADIRNFAHGRHHWFSKHPEDSGIIALSTNNDYEVTARTLGLLPATIPKAHISFKTIDGIEAIAGVILSMYLTSWLGKEKGIDPGRPGVPPYGSKIYRLTANPGFISSVKTQEVAIARKRKLAPLSYDSESENLWSGAYKKFTKRLAAAKIGGVILDYDGTVVDSDKRWDPPRQDMADELTRLLSEGVVIGFATGRGKSIRSDLQQVIPQKFWNKVIIGYYNGSELKALSDNTKLSTATTPIPELEVLFEKLKNNFFLSTLADFDPKKHQLTIKRKKNKALSETFLWDLVQDEFYHRDEHAGEVLRSSHSIDIIATNVSKLSVVKEIRKKIRNGDVILSIGDRGRWPGNDAKLLNESLSLSVDEVCFSPETCWNLCPAGIRGAQGTLYYLSRLKRKNGTSRISL
ncbi:HAD hydrolase family protein [Chryseolinea lacunae]|uniref:HAD hydrolase family protein n=1 Tax=Chryseolinea lacunae TaxID=2801331 RepID=A0ABS1L449_9BACT|nr:HAD hydrolase family protein [Chryseolinea lacunae]MBL0745717.1 HAD hydrolase family protein [Chryseolinea lacunae]